MRRRVVHPYGQSISATRLASLILAMAVLWMLYERMRDPATWKMFSSAEPVANPVEKVSLSDQETIVPGPNHKSDEELAAAQREFEYVIERAPLKSREMDAYWRLMAWSRTEPLADLEEQARREIPFTQLWEQPERYRGQPIRLRLHVRRVLEYDAPENPYGITKCYEAWGWTEESSAFPYVVVFPERPEGLSIGEEKSSEIVFVGYFLKIMSYADKLGKTRGAPLLVGRARLVATPSLASNKTDSSIALTAILIFGAAMVGSIIWMQVRPRKKSRVKTRLGDIPTLDSFEGTSSGDTFFSFDIQTGPRDIEPDVAANSEMSNAVVNGGVQAKTVT